MSITKDFEDKWRFSPEGELWPLVRELLAHARALEAMMKKHDRVQVSIGEDNVCWDYCPECREYLPYGNGVHKSDCQLAKLLEGVE